VCFVFLFCLTRRRDKESFSRQVVHGANPRQQMKIWRCYDLMTHSCNPIDRFPPKQLSFLASASMPKSVVRSGGIAMMKLGSRLQLSLLCTLLLIALGCGSSRTLQSVSVMPAVANGQNGPVAFTATGTFSKPPSPQKLTSQDVTWCVGVAAGACPGNIAVGATVDQNGVASCLANVPSSLPKTWTVMAGKAKSSMNPDGGAQMTIFGSAQLTCP
jgi:hypothetical protein